jgi:hypothetical protein
VAAAGGHRFVFDEQRGGDGAMTGLHRHHAPGADDSDQAGNGEVEPQFELDPSHAHVVAEQVDVGTLRHERISTPRPLPGSQIPPRVCPDALACPAAIGRQGHDDDHGELTRSPSDVEQQDHAAAEAARGVPQPGDDVGEDRGSRLGIG